MHKPSPILYCNSPALWWHQPKPRTPLPPHNSQIDCLNWNFFNKKGLHFLHINVNSLLPKIEEVRFIAKTSKATVIGITDTKLERTIFYAELYIESYSIVRCEETEKVEVLLVL